MSDVIEELLEEHYVKLDTRAVSVKRGAIDECVPLLREHLGEGMWLVAGDANTWEAAGAHLASVLDAAGQPFERVDIADAEGYDHAVCDDDSVDDFQHKLEEGPYVAGLAVGAGTVNDIVKLASHRAGLPMGCVGTAPSMNGYTSKIAAVLSDGVKTTIPCTAPTVVVADLDVMAEAPYRMIASGLGDLISKPVSNADWLLSASLNDTYHSEEAMSVIERGAAMLEGVAERLPERDRDAVAGLVRSLILSGLAMTIAGSSSPASGGEHLISHHIDMTAHAFGEPNDFHGCQVGVGTLTTALFYEKLRALDPAEIDVEARVATRPEWDAYREVLEERFGPLYDAVVQHAEPAFPDDETLRARLGELVDRWDEVLERVGRTLRTRDDIEAELRAADAPVRFSELGGGLERERARRAITHSKDIRNRYTILHLAWELGTLEQWADEALEELY
jgi:glycerol-1-phosphate dehydrogenase [NAD(P)+]